MLARKLLKRERHGSELFRKNLTGTQLVQWFSTLLIGLYLRDFGKVSIRSIIGATEKRRESGTGVAVIGGIGGTESVWLGGGGVYQE